MPSATSATMNIEALNHSSARDFQIENYLYLRSCLIKIYVDHKMLDNLASGTPRECASNSCQSFATQ
jgi:hypothetical protein